MGAQLLYTVRIEGLAVHQHALDDRVAVPVDTDHHLHVLCSFHDVAGSLGHEVCADAKVGMANAVDTALDEYTAVAAASLIGVRRRCPDVPLFSQGDVDCTTH